MRELVRISEGIAFGPSPSIADLRELARKLGFRAVLCLNVPGEEGLPLSPDREASWAHAYELEHARVPVDPLALCPHVVDAFLAALAGLPRPVYVHSKGGRRAALLLAIRLGIERHLGPDEALAEARSLGLDPGTDELREALRDELRRRVPPSAPPEGSEPSSIPAAEAAEPSRERVEEAVSKSV